jgi:hypothetical protein
MLIKEVWKEVRHFHRKLGVPRLSPTSVISDLFPGQFNYCLDEIHLSEKYGNFVDITEDEHFQKMMPVIRWNDFMSLYDDSIKSSDHLKPEVIKQHHLGVFTMSTIGGGHICDRSHDKDLLYESVRTLLDFLTNHIGLDPKRFVITYFNGGVTAREVEASIKDKRKQLKVEVNSVMEADPFSKEAFLEYGLHEDQLLKNNTRDNFLTSNWDILTAPWGYRNEIHYRLQSGTMLDIATIENLVFKPIIEERAGVKYVVDVVPWNKCFVINGIGIERLSLATTRLEHIFDISEFRKFQEIGLDIVNIETIRMLHRIFSDTRYVNISSPSRRKKINLLMRKVSYLPLEDIVNTLKINADVYHSIFPELSSTILSTIEEIAQSNVRI